MAIECEFKWKAHTQEDFSRMLDVINKNFTGHLQGPQKVLNQDYYLDTPSRQWSAHKTALRIRCANGVFEATSKTQTKMVNGKAVRQEETIPLASAGNIEDAVKLLEQKATWQGLPLAGVEVVFTISNHRQIYNLTSDDALYELALDDCQLTADIKQMPLKEIELELKRGSEKEFSAFALLLTEKSGLSVPEKSKVESARSLLEENR